MRCKYVHFGYIKLFILSTDNYLLTQHDIKTSLLFPTSIIYLILLFIIFSFFFSPFVCLKAQCAVVCKCNWQIFWEGGLRGGAGQDRTGRVGRDASFYLCYIFRLYVFIYCCSKRLKIFYRPTLKRSKYTLRSTLKTMKNNSPGVSDGPLN